MGLDELLEGSEGEVTAWLNERNLLHSCGCGYTLYDEDRVAEVVQEAFGDERCEEINQWSWGLADQFGWLWLHESSRPSRRIYRCQYCAGSELSLLADLCESARLGSEAETEPETTLVMPPGEPCVVFVDESYSEQFPRLPNGSMAFGALIVPEKALGLVQTGVESILRECYKSGSSPEELKYSQISKYNGLLSRVGSRIGDLLNAIDGCAVLGIYVPRSGLFEERRRVLKAIGHYEQTAPDKKELEAVEAPEAVEAAVRETANHLAHTLIICAGNYLASLNATARVVLDPRNKRLDAPLLNALNELLPKTPVNASLVPHLDAVVSLPPHKDMERLGNRLTIEASGSSVQMHGLQIADFIAGDVRTYFEAVPELLTEATTEEPLVNKRMLLPQLFRMSKLSAETLRKAQTPGRSALPMYRERLACGQISCYTLNGQMRNIDLGDGSIYDVMD